MRAAITKSVVDKIEAGKIVWDTRVTGFGARRQLRGVHYVLKAKGKWHSIGRHGAPFTVETARAEALRLLGLIVSGEDPRPATSENLGGAVELYLARRKPAMKPRSFEEIERHLLNHAKPLHRSELHEVSRRNIAELLAKIEQGSGPVARNRVRSSLSAFFSWAIREGLAETNPVQGTGKANEGGSRERVLTPKEIGKLWTTLVPGQHTAFVDVIRLLLLTGQRRDEIGGLIRSEVDWDRKVIVLPASRTKNKRVHIVPLSEPALEILGRAFADAPAASKGENDGRVFHSFSWSDEKAKLDAGLRIAPWRIHDIRRSVATMLGELGLAQPHIVETLLNHVSGHRAGVAGVYQRARYENECRAALEAWAEWIVVLAGD
jgi:integrase